MATAYVSIDAMFKNRHLSRLEVPPGVPSVEFVAIAIRSTHSSQMWGKLRGKK